MEILIIMMILVFPMYVGVILQSQRSKQQASCIPHVRGGDPPYVAKEQLLRIVFPMYVGVILWQGLSAFFSARIPHVRGGDPIKTIENLKQTKYSPCTWG